MTYPAPKPWAMYAIYRHPRDYPDAYVCRRWLILPDRAVPVAEKEPVCVSPDLEKCREAVPPGHFRMAANKGDDPCILETWI